MLQFRRCTDYGFDIVGLAQSTRIADEASIPGTKFGHRCRHAGLIQHVQIGICIEQHVNAIRIVAMRNQSPLDSWRGREQRSGPPAREL